MIPKNPMAEAANWNARCLTEEEAPHKWTEAWGQMFSNGIPHDYRERIDFLEKELANCPDQPEIPKYGVGPAFKEMGQKNNKQSFHDDGPGFSDEELDRYNDKKKSAGGRGLYEE